MKWIDIDCALRYLAWYSVTVAVWCLNAIVDEFNIGSEWDFLWTCRERHQFTCYNQPDWIVPPTVHNCRRDIKPRKRLVRLKGITLRYSGLPNVVKANAVGLWC